MVMGIKYKHLLKRGLLIPHPIPLPLRQATRRRSQRGETITTIATALGLVPRTVRHLSRRFVQGGPDAVAPSYPCRTEPCPQGSQKLFDEALALRRQHP